MKDFSNKVATVTGAGSGMGCGRRLASSDSDINQSGPAQFDGIYQVSGRRVVRQSRERSLRRRGGAGRAGIDAATTTRDAA